jgi:hypothetical protein
MSRVAVVVVTLVLFARWSSLSLMCTLSGSADSTTMAPRAQWASQQDPVDADTAGTCSQLTHEALNDSQMRAHRRRSSTASSVVMALFDRRQRSARHDDDDSPDDGTRVAIAYLKRVDDWKAASQSATVAQRRMGRVKTRVDQTSAMVSLLNVSDKVKAARTSFALGAAVFRLAVFVVLIGLMAIVSPLAFDYPSTDTAQLRTMVSDGLSSSFSQVLLQACCLLTAVRWL